MHTNTTDLFTGLWLDYLAITPSAKKVHALLQQHDGQATIVNDHIALRTVNLPGLNVASLAQHFTALGYVQSGEYDFASKKLDAWHYQHPDLTLPKVFISELRVNELSSAAQTIIQKMIAQMLPDAVQADDFLYSGTHWQVSSQDYQTLLQESEYAAWLSAWGFRANHFTVSINHLHTFSELTDVNDLLLANDFRLNTAGGIIKGGAEVCLAQSSTMADSMPVAFTDQTIAIPSCFYEFAQRYAMGNGELYQGFVAASADKIFESTNVT